MSKHKPLDFGDPEKRANLLRKFLETEEEGSCFSVGGLYLNLSDSLTLNDFARQDLFPEEYKKSFEAGNTEIWYRKNFQENAEGDIPFFLVSPPKLSSISESHVLLGKVAEQHKDTIFQMMQSENWAPLGMPDFSPHTLFLKRIGATHSSMSVGDCVIINGKGWMRIMNGWQELS